MAYSKSPYNGDAHALLEKTRDHVIQRLLTTDDEASSGYPRNDMSVMAFGALKLGKKHHLDTVDLLVAANIGPETFHNLVEERLTLVGVHGSAKHKKFAIPEYRKSLDPYELRIGTNALIRLWYFRSRALQTLVASHRPDTRWFSDYIELSQASRSQIDNEIGRTNNNFRHEFHDTRAQWLDEELDNFGSGREDLNGEYYDAGCGCVVVTFRRKIPSFDPLEGLELDEKMRDLVQSAGSGLHSINFQPRRWRSKVDHDLISYIFQAAEAPSNSELVTENMRNQLNALSVQYHPSSIRDYSINDLVPDYGLSYDYKNSQGAPACVSGKLDAASGDAAGKGPFPDAGKIYHRIKWDQSINQNDVMVQYADRHEGMMEKPFSEWIVITEEEDFIPMHRIRRFVRISDEGVLWDREKRIIRLG